MVTVIVTIFTISILILAHEWGHFYSARKLGVKVEEFGIGFPPRLLSWVRQGVRYSLNLLPFGGFVKIFGEHGEGEGERESFVSRPPWQRFTILAAGVAMNVVLAWIAFSVGSGLGVPVASGEGGVVSIVGVAPDSPAQVAGLRFGDEVLAVRRGEEAVEIRREEDVRKFIDLHRSSEVLLTIRREGKTREVRATPRLEVPEGEGPLGVVLARLAIAKTPWYLAPIEGAKTLGRVTAATLQGLSSLFREVISGRGIPAGVSGPVGIFFFARDLSSFGFASLIQFVGILSVNLAVLNFLPIPALDGGRVLFLLVEKLKGSRVDPKLENFLHALGFAFLLLIMLLVTYRDIARVL